ncbi:SDR family oxidoreductase [Variovorax sp. KK3]|uniref:SDR family oxidoreductase n=1 Tax=Variovorax sp. KK3 TaxID=1855728 RepID=UPI00097C0ACD|nr:SDR family oxidoreductase [Variovorax sp. KK3]
MNVTLIGSGLIGGKLASLLEAAGHRVTVASPSRGVNALTGEGLDNALAGADVLVDVSNSPSFAPDAVLQFFRTATAKLLAAARAAGVRHYVALSVVGSDRLPDNGYLRAKLAQEALIRDGGVPYTIVRATQFFEFLKGIADSAGEGMRVSSALFQPIAADDVARFLAQVVEQPPRHGLVEVGGPERLPMHEAVQRALDAGGDPRRAVGDPQATYFGSVLDDRALVAADDAAIGAITLEHWLAEAAGSPAPR